MNGVSLCTGIGGFDIAMEMAGITVAGQVEIDPFCRSVLERHWPHVKRLVDIRDVVGDEFGDVDLMAAGFPCPPVSLAGKRRGAADDRWLWPEVLRLITAMQPTWVCLENVPGLISLGLDGILADLEGAGYEAETLVLPACATGAPHLRERIFVVAHSAYERCEWGRTTRERRTRPSSEGRVGVGQADTDGEWQPQLCGRITDFGRWTGDSGSEEPGCLADTAQRGPRCGTASWPGGQPTQPDESADGVCHAVSGRRSGRAAIREWHDGNRHRARWPQEANDARQRSTGSRRSRDAECRLGRDTDGLPGRLDSAWRWPAGPAEPQAEWEPPRTVTGKQPHRAARLKALGNAIVPQQVYPILAAIMAVEREASV